MRNHNAKSNHRFIASVCRYGALAILALFAFTAIPAMAHNPELMLACGMVLPLGAGLRFMKQDDPGTGSPLTPEAFQKTLLAGVEDLTAKSKDLEARIGKAATGEEMTKLKKEFDDLVDETRALRKSQLRSASLSAATRRGEVSEEAARFMGAVAIIRGLQKGHLINGADRARSIAEEVVGKTALTTTDIPLPVDYGSEVVELVAQYGQARRFGTVFPLGSGSVKLPKLTTSPAFGLIAMSAAIGQKSPQFAWVTFNAEKWGGLVILPNEIDEDSVVAVGQFVARYSAREMAKIEDTVFFAADGTATYDSLEGLTKSVVTDTKVTTLASGKTKYSDVTLAKVREMRSVVDSPALAMGAYYFHPSFEQALNGFNSSGDKPYQANGINGASLDGFPIHWIDTLPAYSASANAASVFGLFGDVSFQYLGTRGGIRLDTSDAPGFANDQLYIRALERFTIGKMATGAVAGIITAAS
ncbi:MAG: phage major capsid protein [Terrimicrobiaceae bacterium]